jgi:hypothetical protein
MKKICLGSLLLSSILLTRCSTDVDLIAPYKETTIVYGLLSPSDTIQYIRVAKAFLGEGNALEMAKVGDSIYYPDNVIDVVLQRWKNNILIDSTIMVRDISLPKDPGIFANQPNVLYRSNDSVFKDSNYKLRIYNKQSGNVTYSETGIVGDISITLPSTNPSILNVNMTSEVPSNIKWFSAPYGKVYSVVIRFNYQERLYAAPNTVTYKYLDWKFADMESRDPNTVEEMILSYLGEDFYKNIASKMVPDNSVERKPLTIEFIFTVGAQEFFTYYLVNQPSLTINQEIPQYTNINNGIGIFSSRRITYLRNKQLDIPSLDSLRNGQYTGNLGFL